MHGNYGYFEEDKLGKPYDWPLWHRLAGYSRSYLKVIGISAVLILLITGFDLTLPYLLKLGIDRYIVPSARQVRVPAARSPALTRFLRQVAPELQRGTAPGQFFVAGQVLRKVDPRVLQQLQELDVITDQRFYSTPIRRADQGTVVRTHARIFEMADGTAYIDYRDLANLSGEELWSLRKGDLHGLRRLGFIFVALMLLSGICTYCQNLLMVYVGQHMMQDLRMQLFGHLQKMSLSFFDRNPVGRLVTRLTNDIQNLDEMFGSVVMTLLKDVILLLGILVILFYLRWDLALVTLSVVPLIMVLFRVFGVQVRGAFRDIRAKLAQINTVLNEYISGIRVIQLFRQEKNTLRRFENLNQGYYQATMRQITLQAIFFPALSFFPPQPLLCFYGTAADRF
ncbi:MAG: ABC transporter ATP-binding protein [Deltaproteobacteria bacterium]|nr:MAG: ABC transporter ATP-binding protein [Deltaproteobacteria bacterium]